MNIPRADLMRLFFQEKKGFDEIAKIYGVGPAKIKKLVKEMSIPLNRTKSCKTCRGGGSGRPPSNPGYLSFDLTKD